ncbi:MAG: AI-2E family transporter [Cellvibrio sp.]
MYKKLETSTFLLCLLLVTILFFWVLKPFFGAIFWACAITIIFFPLHRRILVASKGRRNLSALITLTICILIVVIPFMLLISTVVQQSADVFTKIQNGEIDPAKYIDQIKSAFPVVQNAAENFGLDFEALKKNVLDLGVNTSKAIGMRVVSIGQNTFILALNIVLMLYLTYFLLRDGRRLLELMIRALPLGDKRERLLFAKFGEVTRATIKGNVVIAIVQGSLGGFILWAIGMPGSVLFGVLMAVLSLIPAVGPAFVWVPIAIYLAAIGQTMEAVILALFGALVIGLIDNILRPILVGRDTRMPDYVVLLSTLGGLALFGVNGFAIGPLVAALFMAFWEIFIREIHILAPDGNGEPLTVADDQPIILPADSADTVAKKSDSE